MGKKALAYFLEAHKKHITAYLLKADQHFGSGNISRAAEMFDEDLNP